MIIIDSPQNKVELFNGIEPLEGGLVKGVIDIIQKKIALDAAMHVDLEQYMIELGSAQSDLWGFNLYPEIADESWLEYDSMINIRPRQGNRSRTIEDPELQQRIRDVINQLLV